MEKRLFLLDAYALIYRAYYALIRAPRVTSYGLNTSAIFGFCNTLNDVLRKERPTHIAVCFDPAHGTTFRHEVYPDYKAGRDKQPEDITLAIPFIKDILHAYNIPVIELEGYEADDVIGTLSRLAEKEGFVTYMMTPDKDYGQLVTDKVFMYRPALKGEGFEIRGPEQVTSRYGISSPHQVIDLLALEGDKSDNIPGCPGVGEKTAAKLIVDWGSVENLIEHVGDLKGAIQKKISENAEQIVFSKMLATIKTDVPLPPDITPDALRRKNADVGRLTDIYTELEFRSFLTNLRSRLEAEGSLPEDAKGGSTAAATPSEGSMGSLFDAPGAGEMEACTDRESRGVSYTAVAEASELQEKLRGVTEIGLALVTSGDSPMTMQLHGLAIATAPGEAVYVAMKCASETMVAAVREVIENLAVTVVSHDVKTAMIVLRNRGMKLLSPYFDTAIAHYLLEPEMNHRLSTLATRYLGCFIADSVLSVAANKAKLIAAPDVPDNCCEAADICLQLRKPLLKAVESQGLLPLLNDIEMPLVRVLAAMEYTGVRIDPKELGELSYRFKSRLRELELKAFEIAGTEFNVGSPMQVGEILFDRLKIDPKAKRTKTGAYSTTEEILEKYRAEHPIAGLILDIRALKKLLATYVDSLPTLINPATGKLHTTYNQTVTATGRISSTNPNLQNIPVRTEDGREIRRAFIPDPGDVMLSCDYSQIELRLIADISGDENMIEAFREGHDIHRATAAKIYHLPIEETGDDLRRNAKTANFGIIYGISAFGLSERLGIPRSEAKELIEGYFRTYPQIREYIDRSIAEAREKGYVTTIMGRKRMLPDINSRSAVVRGYAERNAVNAPLQGSAADIIKKAMIDIFNAMSERHMRSRMIMQVHDELIFNVVPDELADLQELVTRLMADAYHGHVALEVSSGVGANWLEAH